MKIAIITARGGSKRIPRKNIRKFCGKPIIAYSIQAAINADYFDEVMVSTDDEEIAEVAKHYGASVPFMRSAQTASDHATTAEVLIEVLQEYQKRSLNPEFACCIYPTAPFVTSDNLIASHHLLLENPATNNVIPITRFSYPIQRALKLENNKIALLNPELLLTRSQDLQPAYHDAGQFYWLRVNAFLATPNLMSEKTAGFVLPEWQVQDIDNEDDWILAEMKYRFFQEKVTQQSHYVV
jgi:N-acylneuraminate cytidylyltransferase